VKEEGGEKKEDETEEVEEDVENKIPERKKLPRRQILSTESESECALSGECAGRRICPQPFRNPGFKAVLG